MLRKPVNFIINNLAVADLLRAIEPDSVSIPSNAAGYIFQGQ